MPTLADLLISNPHGYGTMPPMSRYEGDITNALDPRADAIAQKFGPEAGALAQKLLNGGGMARDTARTIARGLSGIDMAEDAGANLANAVDRGDPLAGAGSVAELGLAALPVAGKFAAPLFETMPRMASMLMAGGLAPTIAAGALSPTEAEARPRKRAPAPAAPEAAPTLPQDDGLTESQRARVQVLQKKVANGQWRSGAERRSIEAELKGLMDIGQKNLSATNAAKNKALEIEATAKAQREADAEAAKQAEDERVAAANTPFKKEHPFLSSTIPVASATLAALLGGKIKGSYVKAFQNKVDDLTQQWGNTTAAAENALKAGDTLTASRLTNEAKGLKDQFDSLSSEGPGGSLAAILSGAAAGEFGQLVPLASDYFKALPGSELERETKEQMTDPVGVGGRILNGLLFGGLPAKIASSVQGAKVNIPIGAGAKTDSLSAILREGGTSEATAAQKALAGYDTARQERLSASSAGGQRNQQAGNADALSQEAVERAGPPPIALPAPEASAPPHHSRFQPRKKGRFNGPPKTPKNDN